MEELCDRQLPSTAKERNPDESVLELSRGSIDDWASIHDLGKTTVSILKKERYPKAEHLLELTPNDLDADCLEKIPLRDANVIRRYFRAAEAMPNGPPEPPKASAMAVANGDGSLVAPVATAPLADLRQVLNQSRQESRSRKCRMIQKHRRHHSNDV